MLLVILASGALVRAHALLGYDGTVSSDTPIFISMADNLGRGLGWRNPTAEKRFLANPLAYRSHPASDPSHLERFGFNDYGLSLIYWAAIHLFGNAAAPHILLLMLQIGVDCLDILLVFWIGRRVAGDALGLLAAALYAGYQPVIVMVAAHPYYFFWQEAFALWNLGLLLLLLGDGFAGWSPGRRLGVALACGAVLGLASVTRPTFYPVGVADAVLVMARWRHEWRKAAAAMAVVVGVQAACMAPVMALTWHEFHQLRPPRPFWHMIYIGIGAYPNPYGIRFDDGCGFAFGRAHGVNFGAPDWEVKYERVMRAEVMRIRREHPWLLYRNFAYNLGSGFTAHFNGRRFDWPGGLRLDLPASTVLRGLLLLLQLAGFILLVRHRRGRERTRESGWAYAATAGQGLYFVAALCAIIPPSGDYNTCYFPTYLLFVAVAGVFVYDVEKQWILAPADPESHLPRIPMLALAAGAGGALCWLAAGAAPSDRMVDLLAGPLAGWTLYQAASPLLGKRGAQAAARSWLALVVLGAMAGDAIHGGLLGRVLGHARTGPVWVGMAALVAAAETGVPPWLLGGMLALASRFHPETAFLPLVFMALLGGRTVWGRLRAMAAAALVVTGGAALATHVPPSAWITTAVFWAAAPFLGRLPGALRGLLVAALLILQWAGFAAWPALALALGAGWLWGRRA